MPQKLEQENDEIFVLLTHLYRDLSRSISQHAAISFSRLLLLHELMHDGEISQAELQNRLGMEGALVTRYVKQMETSGLVSRRTDPKDNRYTLVSLTPVGRSELEKLDSLKDRSENQLLNGISVKDRAAMVRALKRIQENISRWQD